MNLNDIIHAHDGLKGYMDPFFEDDKKIKTLDKRIIRASSVLSQIIRMMPDEPKDPGVYAVVTGFGLERRETVVQVDEYHSTRWYEQEGNRKLTRDEYDQLTWGNRIEFP